MTAAAERKGPADVRAVADVSAVADPSDAAPDPAEHDRLLAAACQHVTALARAGRPPSRVTIRVGDALVEVEWPVEGTVAAGGTPSAPADTDEAQPAVEAGHVVTSPMVGTFYRAPEPGAAPFVSPGDTVSAGQQIGIVEAMKLMNAIEADRDGVVVEVLVDDATPVEYDQPLIRLAPLDDTDR